MSKQKPAPATAKNVLSTNAGDKAKSEQDAWRTEAPSSADVSSRVRSATDSLISWVEEAAGGGWEYEGFERELIMQVFQLGRLLVVLFLCLAGERMEVPTRIRRGGARYKRQPAKSRMLGTFFGKVRYWRAYMHQANGRGGGFYPLDIELGLLADGFSCGLLARAVQLATKMSYAASVVVMRSFLGWAPSTKTVEEAVLGMGRHTQCWFEEQEPPEDDGEVLVAQIDSKATPTARDEEMEKRRGKRQPNPFPGSQRHRGRAKRSRRGSKKRRKKGDKSKNGKMATIVVMYTLKKSTDANGKPVLLGPVNRRVYASYAPKRHAFAIARREADKRGFTEGSGKTVQLVTDGDEDLERYGREFFPSAIHTLDVIHAVEYLWKAAACIHKEGSKKLRQWVGTQKNRLYRGHVKALLREFEEVLVTVKGKSKRKRLSEIANYLTKRTHMMNYGRLKAEDLERASGIAEGAVRFVIAQRFDEGGMRWIRERAEALLQLRCIEVNGDWDKFAAFIHGKLCDEAKNSRRLPRLLQDKAEPLPTYGCS